MTIFTKTIKGRIAEATLDVNGIITAKVFREDSALYNPNSVGGVIDRTGYPNQLVNAPGSTLLRLLDIPILQDGDNNAGYYLVVRGTMPSWSAAVVFISDPDVIDYRQIATMDVQAPIGVTVGKLGIGESTVWDYQNTIIADLIGDGALESMSGDEALKGRKVYLIGDELVLCQNVEQLSARRWRLNGPLVRGWKGTEWAIPTHRNAERFIYLTQDVIDREIDQLADIGRQRSYKAVTSGMTIEATTPQLFTNTGISLKPWSPVLIRGAFDISDNIIITWRRRSRLQGRNGRDFFDPPLGEDTESYEIEILSDNETTVKRTLTATSETVTYTSADQVTDWGATKGTNLHLRIYQISAQVGRGYPGNAVIHPSGDSGVGAFDFLWSDGNPAELSDGSILEHAH